MRRLPRRLLAALIVLGAASCAHNTSEVAEEVADCANFVMSPSQYVGQIRGRLGAMENEELDFVCRAAAYGRAQIIYARMAERRSANPTVKQFAGKTIDSQRKLSRRLDQVAIQHEGITPPPGLDPRDIEARDRLAQLSGDDFDHSYLRDIVREGRAAIALFRAGGALPEPLIGRFASRALPVLEQRVSEAQSLLQETGYSSSLPGTGRDLLGNGDDRRGGARDRDFIVTAMAGRRQ